MRKFARVGRPCRRSASSARTSAGASSASASARRAVTVGLGDDLVEQPLRARRAASASRGAVAVSASAASPIAAAQSASGLRLAQRVDRVAEARRPARRSGRRGRSRRCRRRRAGARRANSRWPSSVIVTPSSSRSRPACHVPAATPLELVTARGAPRRGPSGSRPATIQSCSRARSSSSKRKRRRTGARSARSSTCEAVSRCSASSSSSRDDAQHRVGLAQRAVGEADAQVDRAQPLGRSPLGVVVVAGVASPAPNVAWISGANVSMSGHMTITSRGSSVSSSASSVQDRVAHHLDLARAAVAGVDLDRCGRRDRAAGVGRAAGQRRAGRRAVGADVGLDPAEQRVGGGQRAVVVIGARRLARRREHELHLARVPSPGGQQPVGGERRRSGRRRGAIDRLARRAARRRPAPTAPATGAAGTGGRRGRAASARRTCSWPAGRRVSPNSEKRPAARRATRSSRSRSHARSRPLGRARHADPRAQPAPQLGLPERRLGQGVADRVGIVAVRPGVEHLGAMQRVAVVQAGEVADDAQAPGAAHRVVAPRSRARGSVARLASHGSSMRLLDDRRAAARRRARAATGPGAGSIPEARRDRAGDQALGNGNSTFGADPVGALRPRRRARPTSAGSASAPCRGSGRRRPRRRTGPPAARRTARRARRRGRRRARLGGHAASGGDFLSLRGRPVRAPGCAPESFV